MNSNIDTIVLSISRSLNIGRKDLQNVAICNNSKISSIHNLLISKVSTVLLHSKLSESVDAQESRNGEVIDTLNHSIFSSLISRVRQSVNDVVNKSVDVVSGRTSSSSLVTFKILNREIIVSIDLLCMNTLKSLKLNLVHSLIDDIKVSIVENRRNSTFNIVINLRIRFEDLDKSLIVLVSMSNSDVISSLNEDSIDKRKMRIQSCRITMRTSKDILLQQSNSATIVIFDLESILNELNEVSQLRNHERIVFLLHENILSFRIFNIKREENTFIVLLVKSQVKSSIIDLVNN